MTGNKKSSPDVLVLSTSFPLSINSISGVFVKSLVDALSKHCRLALLVPGDTNADLRLNEQYKVLRFRYGPLFMQRLAHLPGGIPAQIKQQPAYLMLVPVFLLSFLVSLFVCSRGVKTVHANWAVTGAIAGLVKCVRRYKLVTTLRGEDVKQDLGLPNRLFLSLSLRFSDHIVLVSSDMMGLLSLMYPKYKNKMMVIHNGVADDFSAPQTFRKLQDGGLLNLIFVGSLIKRKNVMTILEALSALGSVGKGICLNIVGDGPEKASLEHFVQTQDLASEVIFHNELTQPDVARLMRECQVYVSASLHEGRPNGVIEAMASGCCVILSRINGHLELVGDQQRGVLFEASSAMDLKEKLVDLIASPETVSNLGGAARQYIKNEGLTWGGCAAHYLSLFDLKGRD